MHSKCLTDEAITSCCKAYNTEILLKQCVCLLNAEIFNVIIRYAIKSTIIY